MSHITTVKSAICFKNEAGIKAAIALMQKDFAGMTIEQKTPDMILIRYAPIEVYQTKGNMRLIRNKKTGVFDLQLDYWNCQEQTEKVKKSFEVNYQRAGALAYARKIGYRSTEQPTKAGIRIEAVRYG
jgi:hypothetical protein